MTIILLIPCLLALFLVLRGRLTEAFLSLYLPAMILLPNYYVYRPPHLPLFAVSEWTAIPIGVASLVRLLKHRRLVVMDFLILAFLTSITLSEVLAEPAAIAKDGMEFAIASLVCPTLVYVLGRELIEPAFRLVTTQRIIFLTLLLAPFALFEWRMGQNLFSIIGSRVFNFPAPVLQIRGGHGRAAMSFTDAEIAGIAFGMFASLNAWLAYVTRKGGGSRFPPFFARMEKFHVPGAILLGYVLLTESRGPLLGLGAAYLVLQIPRFRNQKIAAVCVALVLCAGYIGVQHYIQNYVSGKNPNAELGEQQSSVQYRLEMQKAYAPLVKRGGWLGYGLLGHPTVGGFRSTDDEFLLVQLGQGRLGLLIFILIEIECFRSLLFKLWRMPSPEDRAFVCSMIAAMTVFWYTITTVYMGEQLPQVAFLFIGWSQSIVATSETGAAAPQTAHARFRFRRVYQ